MSFIEYYFTFIAYSELNTLLKKAGIILFFIILLMQSGGLLLFYQLKQLYQKYEMQLVLLKNETKLEQLILSNANYHKYKLNNDELLIDGKMYDIKTTIINGNTIEVYAIHDKEEENAINAISKTLNTNDRQGNKIPVQLIKLLSFNYLNTISNHKFFIHDTLIKLFQLPINFFISHKTEILSPPPEFI